LITFGIAPLDRFVAITLGTAKTPWIVYWVALLLVLIVLAIIGILGTLLIPVYAGMRSRAQRVQCIANLHSLYIAADLFLQRNGSWPQIARGSSDTGDQDFANAWINALPAN
jgi:type II secretory pathway pseudopilin PulG